MRFIVSCLSVLSLVACTKSGTPVSEGGGGQGGGVSGGGGQGAGEIAFKNLNVTIDRTQRQIRLTTVISNGTDQTITGCNVGTVSTDGGEVAPIVTSSGVCDGFVPEGAEGQAEFCAQDDFYNTCEFGLGPNQDSSVGLLLGDTFGDTPASWEASGTVYTVRMQFVLADAALVDVVGTAVVP